MQKQSLIDYDYDVPEEMRSKEVKISHRDSLKLRDIETSYYGVFFLRS